MSCDTVGESFPSKYQQIRWIVSLQLISPVPSEDVVESEFSVGSVHLSGQNVMENTDSNRLKMKEKRQSSDRSCDARLATLPLPLSGCRRVRRVKSDHPGRLMLISRSAAMRSSSGGCVLKSELQTDPPPNMGF